MDIIKKIAELSEGNAPFILATIIKTSGSSPAKPGFRLAVSGPGQFWGTVGGGAVEKKVIDEALEILEGKKTLTQAEVRKIDLSAIGMKCGGTVELLLEHFGGRRDFIVFGGGHLGRALSPILEQLGYDVTVFDNRDEVRHLLNSKNRSITISDYSDITPVAELLRRCEGCFIATHAHQWDKAVLRQVVETSPALPYIGMIGSKTKVRATLNSLQAEGIELPGGLYTPVGLALGGDSAAEIAVSVAAEIVSVKNGRELPHMKIDFKKEL